MPLAAEADGRRRRRPPLAVSPSDPHPHHLSRPRNQPKPTTPINQQAANALTFDELQGLTYLQVKGSGIANTCPVLEGGSTNVKDLKAGTYKFDKFCIEPTSFTVKEDAQVGETWA